MILKIHIIFTAIWWSTTCLIDFFLVPTLFRSLDDVMQAGAIGIKVFRTYNYIEVFLGLGLMTTAPLLFKKGKKAPLILTVLLLFIASLYTGYLTPKIVDLTAMMNQAHAGVITGLEEINKEHQFYHHFYVRMDSVKIILLLILQGLSFRKKENI